MLKYISSCSSAIAVISLITFTKFCNHILKCFSFCLQLNSHNFSKIFNASYEINSYPDQQCSKQRFQYLCAKLPKLIMQSCFKRGPNHQHRKYLHFWGGFRDVQNETILEIQSKHSRYMTSLTQHDVSDARLNDLSHIYVQRQNIIFFRIDFSSVFLEKVSSDIYSCNKNGIFFMSCPASSNILASAPFRVISLCRKHSLTTVEGVATKWKGTNDVCIAVTYDRAVF